MELPTMFRVLSNVKETHDIFTLSLAAVDGTPFEFLPGQFNMLSLFGNGEVPLSICSDPRNKDILVHTLRSVGAVTEGLRNVRVGDELGVRGPFGTSWPMTKNNCDVLVIGGGVALPPLRTALYLMAGNLSQYKRVTFLYGARTPSDLLAGKDIEFWQQKGIDVQVTVDKADEGWKGHVGVVTTLIPSHVYDPGNTLVFTCGPEIMMHFAVKELLKASVPEENIYLSSERNMQCGTGFCGHCQFGPYFICKDGPVFAYPQIKKWLTIKEL
jgi:NAD(P)H-flavin reductase